MGEVVAFKTRARTARPDAEPRSGDAQILFFLGVRYVRMDETPYMNDETTPDRRDTPRGGKKRKTRARA